MQRVGRDRTKNKRMPKGWAPAASGTIYFRPTNAIDKEIVRRITGGPLSLKLGESQDEAATTFAVRIVAARAKGAAAAPGTVAEICAKAREKYLPTIANLDTRAWRSRHVDELEATFGTRRYARNVYDATKAPAGTYLLAMEVQAHIDKHALARPVAVNRAVKTWEILFADARRRWGLTEYNPCAGLSFNPEAPRDVLPEDVAIRKVYRRLDPPGRFMVAMIRYYGRRRGELLKLSLSSEQDDGLHLVRGKARSGRPGKALVIRWDPWLRRKWTRLMRWRAAVKRDGALQTTMAILNRKGKPYTKTGFASAWRRAQIRAGVRGTFTFHDIRATNASAADTVEEAQNMLAHDDRATTVGIYRRGPHVIDLDRAKRGRK